MNEGIRKLNKEQLGEHTADAFEAFWSWAGDNNIPLEYEEDWGVWWECWWAAYKYARGIKDE